MTLPDLLNRTATVTHRSQTGAADRYGAPEWEETETTGVPYRREEHTPSEDLDERNTQQATHLLFFDTDLTIDGSDTVTDEEDGIVLEIVGPPRPVDGRADLHHWEADARETDQREASTS